MMGGVKIGRRKRNREGKIKEEGMEKVKGMKRKEKMMKG